MRLLFDFKCIACDKIVEALVENNVKHINCPDCKITMMKRMISPVRSALDPHAGFPDATDKWTKSHEKEGRKPSESHPNGW